MDSASLPVEPDYKRKPNFTDMEKLFLLQQYSFYKPILSSKLCDSATTRQKQDTWQIIANALNQQNPTVERTAKEVKKKWENLATLARKEISEFRTGSGRSLLRPPSALTLKILELLDDISFNPALASCSGSDGSFTMVKEEIWDDDTGSAEMSPSHAPVYEAAAPAFDMPPPPSLSFGLVGQQRAVAAEGRSPSSSATNNNNNGSISPDPQDLFPLSVHHVTSIRPPPPPLPPPPSTRAAVNRQSHNSSSGGGPERSTISPSPNELASIKRRKANLEAERLELENEKLRLEMEILRERLKILRENRRTSGALDGSATDLGF